MIEIITFFLAPSLFYSRRIFQRPENNMLFNKTSTRLLNMRLTQLKDIISLLQSICILLKHTHLSTVPSRQQWQGLLPSCLLFVQWWSRWKSGRPLYETDLSTSKHQPRAVSLSWVVKHKAFLLSAVEHTKHLLNRPKRQPKGDNSVLASSKTVEIGPPVFQPITLFQGNVDFLSYSQLILVLIAIRKFFFPSSRLRDRSLYW